ncbi:MAG TPA: hypothetical protein VFV38_06855 [Ktedonobacteraceae bacterium]|nr:hypothetical protein [Ktedonobacteraceae bacterium]
MCIWFVLELHLVFAEIWSHNITSEAATYLDEALNYIQRYALKKATLDWQAICQKALFRIRDAQTQADTHATLRWVLSRLGDRHSHLLTPKAEQRRREGAHPLAVSCHAHLQAL